MQISISGYMHLLNYHIYNHQFDDFAYLCCQGVVTCAARVWSGVLPRCSQTYILGNGLHSLDPKLYRFQPKEKKKCKDIIKVIIWVNQIQVFLQAPKVF